MCYSLDKWVEFLEHKKLWQKRLEFNKKEFLKFAKCAIREEIYLLELRSDEHGGDTEQLELVERDFLPTEVTIDDVDRDKERFGQQVELNLNYDQPIDEDLTLMRRYFPVKLQVVAPWHED